MIMEKSKITCDYCGKKDYRIISKYTRFEKNNILKCNNCDLVFLQLKQDKKQIEDFYRYEYRNMDSNPIKSAKEQFNDPIVREDCINRIKWIKKNVFDISGKRILEIGCASGYLLNELYSEGAKEVVGIELTETYAEYATNLGFNIFKKPIEEIDFFNEFDLVITFHALEHVVKPKNVLNSVYKSLTKNGIFMGEVPNQDDWRLKIFDNEVVKRFHYDPCHNYYFSPKTLNNYLNLWSNVSLETYERYNSFIQLSRILRGEYNNKNVDEILKKDIFSKNNKNVRLLNLNNKIEIEMNKFFGNAVNNELMGNCLRWIAKKI